MSIQRATNSYKFNKKQTNMTNKIKKLTDKKKTIKTYLRWTSQKQLITPDISRFFVRRVHGILKKITTYQ